MTTSDDSSTEAATTKKAATKKTATKKTTKKAATKSIEAEVETDETVESPADDAAVEAADTDSDSGESGSRRKKTTRKSSRKSEGKSAGAEDGEDSSTDKPKSKGRRDRRRPDRAAIEVTPSGPKAPKGSRLMLVDEVPGESCRIGILENGRLEELFVERAQSSTAVGNIYKARVVNVERAIQAAFVDYGQGMNGFLHVSDLHPRYFPGGDKTEKVGRKTPRRDRPPIEDALKKGQEILVQVLKQGVGTKGPTVTSYLSIPGRLMVMMPGMDRVGVSRKVDDEQRDRMRKILDQLDLPEGFGFILRTAGYDKTKTELKRDVTYLRRVWEQLEKRMDKVGAPSELYTEGDLLVRTIRDVVDDSIGSIVVNSATGFERASTFLKVIAPKSGPKVRHYDDAIPLFDAFGLESQIEMIHAREVPLKSGGALVIDQTEAMVAIDVNSGRSRGAKDAEANAVSTNREAVDEIARQLRLRDQGGLVVCDLIDMRFARNRKLMEERLAENLGRDRARTTFLPISEFGLVEMTRQRIRPSIRSQYFSPCSSCNGLGEVRNADSVAADAVRRASRLLAIDAVARVELVCGARVASALLAGHRRRIDALERESGGRIDIRISEQISGDRFDAYAYDDRNADLDLSRLPKISKPDVESLPTEIVETDETEETSGSGGRRRRRRRRKPAPADVVAIALAGGFEDEDDDEDDEILEDASTESSESSDGSSEGDGEETGGRRRRRRRRRRRGRGGDADQADAPSIPVPTEPIKVHALAKELGIKSRELLDAVAEKIEELELKGHQSSIPADMIIPVRSLFEPPAAETPEDPPSTDGEHGEPAESGPEGSDAGTDEDAPPKKKRRRRRRGGRRRRGRGGDGGESDEKPEGEVEPAGDGESPAIDESGDEPEPVVDEVEPAATDDVGDADETDQADQEPTVENADEEDDEDAASEPSTTTAEATPAGTPRPRRRSLYGGRFQRTGAAGPENREDR